ncbi:hypothetical protein [Desulfofustis glycolicus]|uniref:Uncharacterized protein n=1 Tax=Desulfofustis glycolicus DSM 9705 TaxID=1121409 RepID=A0A1M5YVD0_9BACT|nr:hypothetical protein [Desulfofustis glycolicus]SHI16062.1 hypothetical protein SAMN02745124_04497 [Desulfofustis glycolicus DSM 9705]
MFTQAFGISSLVLAIVSIFIPVYGVFISGLSGVFAWCSVGRAAIFGLAAVIINLCNVLFLSPVFLSLLTIDSVNQLSNQDKIFKYWVIVLVIQLIAIFIFLFNAVLLNYISRKRSNSALGEKYTTSKANDVQHSYYTDSTHIAAAETTNHLAPSPLTKVLINKVYGNRKGERTFWINRFNNVSADNTNTSKRRKDYNPVYIVGIVFLLCGGSAIGAYHVFFKKEPYVPLNRVYEAPRIPAAQKPPPNRSTQSSTEGSYCSGV